MKFYFFNSILSLLIILMCLMIVSFLTLWERKLLAGIQRRHGPTFVGIFGLLQPFSDGLKLVLKSVNVPQGAYYYIYFLSSLFALVLSLLPWSVIPFSSVFTYADINFSLLFTLAVSSLNVYTILFSGWASNSKYGLIGSIRAGAQMISYEIPMSLALFPIVLLASSMNIQNIVFYQAEECMWNFYLLPSLFIFFVTALAETNRAPFDLPEAESELVAGYNMEYSSMTFAVFFLAEYNHIVIMSSLIASLFFGGWLNPFFDLASLKVILLKEFFEILIFFIKIMFIVSFFIVVRASVPRYKFTHLISVCWCSMNPFATLLVLLQVLWFININFL